MFDQILWNATNIHKHFKPIVMKGMLMDKHYLLKKRMFCIHIFSVDQLEFYIVLGENDWLTDYLF